MKCLAVDSDFDIASSYVKEWAKRNVVMDCANDMSEAISKLQSFKPNEYIFVGINGDAIDYLPLLKVMRSITNTPILIATSNFTTEKEIEAMANGADLFARWHNTPEDNVSSVLAHIARKTKRDDVIENVLIYKNLIIAPFQHNIFIGNKILDLTRQEYELLQYFVLNAGNVLTYRQIYKTVWNDEYDVSTHETIKALVKRLRKKITNENGNKINIQNKWAVGYTLPLD